MSIRFLTWMGLAVIGIVSGGLAADPLPAKDTSSGFPITQYMGFSDGTLYLYTGNTIYSTDLSNPANPTFTAHMTNLESSFTTPPTTRDFEGAFATAPGGKAMISFGFSDWGVLAVDLNAQTTQDVTDFDENNIFSIAGRSDGSFYVTDATTFSDVYRVNSTTLAKSFMVDPTGANTFASGGMAFDSAGNLYLTAFDFTTGPSPSGTSYFYRIDAADIAAFETSATTPPVTLLGTGLTNGSAQVVVGSDGNIYFNTSTGIGMFNVGSGLVLNLLGDINDPMLFSYGSEQPFGGLAFDELTGRLYFAQFNEEDSNYYLSFITVPEPVSAVILAAGLAAMVRPRKRGGWGRS